MASSRCLAATLALQIASFLIVATTFAQDFGNREYEEASVYGRRSVARVAADVVPVSATQSVSQESASRKSVSQPSAQLKPERSLAFPSLNVDSNTAGESGTPALPKKNQFAAPLVTVTSSLAVVLGLFAVLVWISRKYGSKSMGGSIPNEVMESLGSTAIDPRTRITMIRLGGRILVVAQTATGIQPISEITDSEEVRRLTALCVGNSKAQFATTLKSIEGEPVGEGFLDQPPAAPKPRHQRQPIHHGIGFSSLRRCRRPCGATRHTATA